MEEIVCLAAVLVTMADHTITIPCIQQIRVKYFCYTKPSSVLCFFFFSLDNRPPLGRPYDKYPLSGPYDKYPLDRYPDKGRYPADYGKYLQNSLTPFFDTQMNLSSSTSNQTNY